MASAALAAFAEAVNKLSISAANKARLIEASEALYVAATKEEARHLRKHLLAIAEGRDPGKVEAIRALIDRVIATDDRIVLEVAKAEDF